MKLCGILNYTDNSFSDGGRLHNEEEAIEKCLQLFRDGADIVDIGAQSTSYSAIQDTPENEWGKIKVILTKLPSLENISLDSYNYETINKAVDLGLGYINDVSGGIDLRILDLVASNAHIKYICMYSLCIPANKDIRVRNVDEIYSWFEQTVRTLKSHGIQENQMILDPGIGFVTNQHQSFEIIRNCAKLRDYGVQTMIGHSRKSYLESITNIPPSERDLETVVASLYMYHKVDYLRVHNVQMHKRAFEVWNQLT